MKSLSKALIAQPLLSLGGLFLSASTFFAFPADASPSTLCPDALIVDAGSTGSRVHHYQRHAEGWHERSVLEEEPGLSSGTEEEAAERLLRLIEEGVATLPESARSCGRRDVLVFGTGGMRALPPAAAERRYQRLTELALQAQISLKARTLSGEEEAAYGWVAVAALLGELNTPAAHGLGALDLGGASFQIAYATMRGDESHRVGPNDERRFRLRSLSPVGSPIKPLEIDLFLSVYSLPWGQETVPSSIQRGACATPNEGGGQLERCSPLLQSHFWGEAAQEQLPKRRYYATGLFAYHHRELQIPERVDQRIRRKASAAFCTEPLARRSARRGTPAQYLTRACLTGGLIDALLRPLFPDTTYLSTQLSIHAQRVS